MLDTIIKNGTIVDGTKAARYRADLGIRGDRIRQIGRLDDSDLRNQIDAPRD
jgi:N-acyl-D-amino-acid deacylase